MSQTVDTPEKVEPTYTNLDLNMLKKCVFVRGVTIVERAMISSVINEIAELADAASGDLCMTFENVRQLADGSFLGVDLDSPDTRNTTDYLLDKKCVRIYICENGSTVQEFNVIMSYQGLMSLIGNFTGFAKFTLKNFKSESTSSESGISTASVKPEAKSFGNVDDNDAIRLS